MGSFKEHSKAFYDGITESHIAVVAIVRGLIDELIFIFVFFDGYNLWIIRKLNPIGPWGIKVQFFIIFIFSCAFLLTEIFDP